MFAFTWPSGWQAVRLDVSTFFASVRFERVSFFWLLVLPVIVFVLQLLVRRLRSRQLEKIGRPTMVFGLLTRQVKPQRWAKTVMTLSWLLLVVALAEPKWGRGDTDGVAVGRDIVFVFDFSKSMLATDLKTTDPRWQEAVRSVRDWVNTPRNRGGDRIGVVIFASRPSLVVPLTTDFGYLDLKLTDLQAEPQPNALRPLDDRVKSGTRIGAALELAVNAHDPRFPGSQDIVLFTDGDDPEPDREWSLGVTLARQRAIPVHVVGIGNPQQDFTLLLNDGQDAIATKLIDDVTGSIASEGKGEYLGSGTERIDLETFLRKVLESKLSREVSDDATHTLRSRSVWFFAVGLFGLGILWLLRR